MRLAADLRLSAVVAAAVACAIIAVAHVWFDAAFWLANENEPGGWTVYPPLVALPQTASTPDFIKYLVYMGSLTSAAVAGGISVGCLLAAAVVRRRQPAGIAQHMLPLWLALILLLPLAVHVIGWGYRIYQAEQQESILIQE